jgi:hypothetical protein
MTMSKCTNCGAASATDYCADCEQFRAALERLRAAGKKFRAAKLGARRAKAKGGASFREQCLKYGRQLQAEGKLPPDAIPEVLPLSGQDAALPVGDR